MEHKAKMLAWQGGQFMLNIAFANAALSWCVEPRRQRRRRAHRVPFRSCGIPQSAFTAACHAPPLHFLKIALSSLSAHFNWFRPAICFMVVAFSFLFIAPSWADVISGKIVNLGNPIKGAVVSAEIMQSSRNGNTRSVLSDTTGDDGVFVISYERIKPDTIDVAATALNVGNIYPNPGGRVRGIDIDVSESFQIRMEVYNILGEAIGSVCDRALDPGKHHIRVDMPELADGVYFAKITAGQKQSVEKFTLLSSGLDAAGSSFKEKEVISPTVTLGKVDVSGENDASFIVSKQLANGFAISESYGLGNISVDLIPRQFIVSAKGVDVFGTPIGGVEFITHYTVAGHHDSVKAASDAEGNVSMDISIQETDVSAVFAGNAAIDSVVATSGEHVPRQKVSGKKPFSDLQLENIIVNTYVNEVISLYDLFAWPIDVPLPNMNVTFVGKNNTYSGTTSSNGTLEKVIEVGEYDVTISDGKASDNVLEGHDFVPRHARITVKGERSEYKDWLIRLVEPIDTDYGMAKDEMGLLKWCYTAFINGNPASEWESAGGRWATPPVVYFDTTNVSKRGWFEMFKNMFEKDALRIAVTPLYPNGFFSDVDIRVGRTPPRTQGEVQIDAYNFNDIGIWGQSGIDIENHEITNASSSFNIQIPDSGMGVYSKEYPPEYQNSLYIGFKDLTRHEKSVWEGLNVRFYVPQFGDVKGISLIGLDLFRFNISDYQPVDFKILEIIYSRPVGWASYKGLMEQPEKYDCDLHFGEDKIGF